MSEIHFPVFQLTSRPPQEVGGIVYYLNESFNQDNAQFSQTIRIVDDRNLPFETLSRRRLQIVADGGALYPIRRAIYFLGDFIKLVRTNVWFIDSTGRYFQYKKTTRAKLRFYKVQNIFPLTGGGAIVQVQSLPQRFKVLFKPKENLTWAGVLELNKVNILYGLYPEKYPDTWRAI